MAEEESSKTGFLKALILPDKKTASTGCLWKTKPLPQLSPANQWILGQFYKLGIYDFEMSRNILRDLCT